MSSLRGYKFYVSSLDLAINSCASPIMQGDLNFRKFTPEQDETLIWNMLQSVDVKYIAEELSRRVCDVRIRMRELRALRIPTADINNQYQA